MPGSAIAYLRISEDPLDKRLGVERQRADVHELAGQLGVELGQVFEDNDVSAYTARKSTSAWHRALVAIERDRPDYLLVFKQDRIGRRLSDVEGLEELCRATGTRVVAVEGGDVFSNPAWPVLAAVAKMESQNTSIRVRRAQRSRREAGLSVNGGIRPYGFEPDRATLVPHEVAVLRRVANQIIAGQSLRSVVAELNDAEEPTVTGARWSVNVLRQTLSNPRYVGELTKGRGPTLEVMGKASWQAVFDRATWEALQAAMVRVQRASMGAPKRSLLAGLVRCGLCLTPMVSMGTQTRPIYRCNPNVGGCGRTSRNRHRLDEYVVSFLLERESDELLASERERAFADLRGLNASYNRVRWRLDDASFAHREGRLESRDFYPLYDELRRERSRLERRLGDARRRLEEVKRAEAAREEFDRWPLDRQRAWIASRVVTVIVRQPGKGRAAIDPETVDIELVNAESPRPLSGD